MKKEINNHTKKDCDHKGFHIAPAQSIFVTPNQLWIITSHICGNCGRLFTNINPVDLNNSGLAIAKGKLPDTQLIH